MGLILMFSDVQVRWIKNKDPGIDLSQKIGRCVVSLSTYASPFSIQSSECDLIWQQIMTSEPLQSWEQKNNTNERIHHGFYPPENTKIWL